MKRRKERREEKRNVEKQVREKGGEKQRDTLWVEIMVPFDQSSYENRCDSLGTQLYSQSYGSVTLIITL